MSDSVVVCLEGEEEAKEHQYTMKANSAMGASSSRLPVTSKFTIGEENDRIKYGASSMQGWRPNMEDARATILDLDGSNSTSFFGVYDGHGGSNVALYCASRFHFELTHDEDYQNDLAVALRHVFFRIDEQLKELDDWRASVTPYSSIDLTRCVKDTAGAKFWFSSAKTAPYNEGSTACVALIAGNQIIVGNVGDSRCVLSRNGQAIDLSVDHKPHIASELDRIIRAGGRVLRERLIKRLLGKVVGVQLGPSRVNGNLSMSRAIGDFALKNNKSLPATEQMVTCNPDINTVPITHDTEFLLIASDGVWDVAESQSVVNFVHDNLRSGETDLRGICERLLDNCIMSRDNTTVILVQFKQVPGIPALPPAPLPTVEEEEEEEDDDDTGGEIIEVKEAPSCSRRAEARYNDDDIDDEGLPPLLA